MNESLDYKAEVEQLALSITKRKLEVPALFFLESHQPVLSLASHAATILMPALSMFVPAAKITVFQKVLESPDAVESLIARLEELHLQEAA